MVNYAKSKTLQKREGREKLEKNIAKAVEAYEAEQRKPKGQRRGLRKIVAMFEGVTVGTLHNRVNGKRSILDFNATKAKLMEEDERALTDLIRVSSDCSCPFTHDDIRRTANRLLEARYGPDYTPCGTNFVQRFIERHHIELKTYWSTHLDVQRANGLNKAAVSKWFDIVETEIVNKGILPGQIYGMDESGFPPANDGVVRVVGTRGKKIQHKRGGGNRENVTAMVTICGNGSYLKPVVIFKGQNLWSKWIENNIADARLVHAICYRF